jgi:integrase/recombinase XerD
MRNVNSKNERIKRRYREYLANARGRDEKTIRQYESALHRFEETTKGADFKAIDRAAALRFKSSLVNAELAPSTRLTILRHVQNFFLWLAEQNGCRKINRDSIEYLRLTDKETRAASAKSDRPYPSLKEMELLLDRMPSETNVQKRDRALIAFLTITGIRDGALISLKLKHVNIDKRVVTQNPREVATKASKRIDTFFFEFSARAIEIFEDYVDMLRDVLLFSDDAPLFPKTALAVDSEFGFTKGDLMRGHWANAGPIQNIVRRECQSAGLTSYTPHSFRKMIVAECYKRDLSHEEMKAISQNLGHEELTTTINSYGKVGVERQGDLIRRATNPDNSSSNDDDLAAAIEKVLAARKSGVT